MLKDMISLSNLKLRTPHCKPVGVLSIFYKRNSTVLFYGKSSEVVVIQLTKNKKTHLILSGNVRCRSRRLHQKESVRNSNSDAHLRLRK